MANLKFYGSCAKCNRESEEEEDVCLFCELLEKKDKEPEHMRDLRSKVFEGRNVVIIGPAGCGKSVALRAVADQLKLDPSSMFDILCPTGNAAINVSGITYHTVFAYKLVGEHGIFFNMSPSAINSASKEAVMEKMSNPRFRPLLRKIQQLTAILWDEFSMISAQHYDTMNKLCQAARNDDRPFGGIQNILFGDPFQLKPVRGEYIFQSTIWDTMNFYVHEMSGDLFRYKEKLFADITRLLRLGIIAEPVVRELKKLEIEPSSKIMELYFRNGDANQSNKKEYEKLRGEETIYPSTLSYRCVIITPTDKLELKDGSLVLSSCSTTNNAIKEGELPSYFETKIQEIYKSYKEYITKNVDRHKTEIIKNICKVYGTDSSLTIKLKPESRVICTMNMKDSSSPSNGSFKGDKLLYANGTTGKIQKCKESSVIMELDEMRKGTRTVEVEYRTMEQSRRFVLDKNITMDVKVEFRHIPLRLGYSITTHRSQGLTLDTVMINGKNIRKQCGLVYVALSRCRSMDRMFLKDVDLNKVQVSSVAIEKFNEHYKNEISYLKRIHPEWFDSFQIVTDDDMSVQSMCKVIHGQVIEQGIIHAKDSDRVVNNRGSGQTKLRKWLLQEQKTCLITGEDIHDILEAAHLREYSDFTEENKSDSHNGNAVLMRCDLHALFDRGFFSFEDDGSILQSRTFSEHPIYSGFKKVSIPQWVKLENLAWHRKEVFRMSK